MRRKAMFAVNQDKIDKSAGQRLKELCGTILEQLAVIKDRSGLPNLVRWLQDEAQHKAMLRELNLLNDRCLNDIGRRRALDPKTDDLVKRLRVGGYPVS
jgi:hypothetical protein